MHVCFEISIVFFFFLLKELIYPMLNDVLLKLERVIYLKSGSTTTANYSIIISVLYEIIRLLGLLPLSPIHLNSN